MEEAIQKADILIEALSWIRQFRGKVTVIKLGGSVMEDPRSMTHLLLDIIFMETVGMRPVLVHGGGAAISRAMDRGRPAAALRPGPPLHRRRHAGHRRAGAGRRNQRGPRAADPGVRRQGPVAELPHDQRALRPPLDARRPRRSSRSTWATSARLPRPMARSSAGFARWARAGHPLDVRRCQRPEAERQRRHGRHGRRPGPAGREDGLPQRRQRRPPRQERSRTR